MRIEGYTQTVARTGGTGSAPTISGSAGVKIAQSQAVDLSPVIKGIGNVVDTINYVHEQEDKKNILAAMDSYNQGVNNLLHNDVDGLMNTREQGADGIADKYIENTQKLKTEIMGNAHLHFRDNQLSLDNFFNKATEQNFERVRAHQYRQGEIVKDNHLKNIEADCLKDVVQNYADPQALAMTRLKLGIANDLRYSDYGPERVELAKRAAYGNLAKAAMNAALNANDYTAFEDVRKEYGEFMDAGDLLAFNKVAAQKQSRSMVRNDAEEFASGNMSDEQIRNILKSRKVQGISAGSRVTPIAEGIEDAGLSRTNRNLVNGVNMLNAWVYNRFGRDMLISGGARSAEHNAAVNGTAKSWHLRGGALDIDLSMFDEGQRAQILQKAKEMGFNDDGENMYHDKGSGLHAHLIMPKSGKFNVGGERDYTDEEIDQVVHRMHMLRNDRKRQQREAVSNATYAFAENLFENKGMSYTDAVKLAESQAGNNMELSDAYMKVVNARYGRSKSGPGAKADSNKIKLADEMLASGAFKGGMPEYLEWLSSIGASPAQLQQGVQNWKDYSLGEGKFAYSFDGFKSAIMGETGLKGAETDAMWNGTKLNARMAMNDWIATHNGQKPSYEETKNILRKCRDESVPVRVTTRNESFFFDEKKEDADVMSWKLANYGVVKVEPMVYGNAPKGPALADDMYLVRFRDGSIKTMNGTRLYALSNGAPQANDGNEKEQ